MFTIILKKVKKMKVAEKPSRLTPTREDTAAFMIGEAAWVMASWARISRDSESDNQ